MKCTYNKRSGILLLQVVSLLFAYVAQVQAGISVQIFSRDEALSESNMSKPSIYIKNTGNVALNGVKFYYHFTTESGKTPILEKYYIPGFTVALIAGTSGNYKLEYTMASTLNAGAVVPGTNGSSIGLHYNTWSAWDKTNDFSNNQSAAFVENQNIPVYYLGTKIYGNEPGGNSTPPPGSPIADIRLNSFALYSTQQTIIKERSVFSGGGAVGSNVSVEIKENAVVHGNVVSGGNATLWSHILIDGNITLGGTLVQQGTGNTFATLLENASVTTLTLPDYVVTTNTNNITVNQSQTVPLYPGIYGDLNVLQYGVLQLYPGNYTFKKFYIENDAQVVFMIGDYLDQIDISSSGEFDIQDRAELKFNTLSYAPSVNIYSKDPNTLRIGVDAKTAGIITAPLATVNMYSGARCDGAIYAKIINVEPDAIINSAYVDPNGDDDSDGVPTGIEIDPLIGTNPQDPTDYIPVAIPRDVIIDNTQEVTIIYSLQPFYTIYPESSSIVLVCPPGSLIDPYKAPILQLVDTPSVSSGEIPDTSDYNPVGLYLEVIGNPVKPDSSVFYSLPLPGNAMPGSYNIVTRDPITNDWAGTDNPDSLIFSLDSTDQALLLSSGTGVGVLTHINPAPPRSPPAAVVWKKTGSIVAYFDDGTVFSSNGSEILINCTITNADESKVNQENPGNIVINYTSLSGSPFSKTLFFDVGKNEIFCNEQFKAPNDGYIVNSVTLNINDKDGKPLNPIVRSPNQSVGMGEWYWISIDFLFGHGDEENAFHFSKKPSMSFESQPFAGDGLILEQSGNFTYSYFLKDHLGSTRMVLGPDNTGNYVIKQALMYQPYGTVSNVDEVGATSTDPLRQKFTTKEFDDEGVSYESADIRYDLSISVPNDQYTITGDITFCEDLPPAKIEFYYDDKISGDYSIGIIGSSKGNTKITSIVLHIKGPNNLDFYYTVNGLNFPIPVGNFRTLTLNSTITDVQTASGNGTSLYEVGELVPLPDDPTIANYYFGARYYNPELGIWNSPDPMDQYWDAYSYCGMDPINLIDNDGRNSIPPPQKTKKMPPSVIYPPQGSVTDDGSSGGEEGSTGTDLSGKKENGKDESPVLIVSPIDPSWIPDPDLPFITESHSSEALGNYYGYQVNQADATVVKNVALGLSALASMFSGVGELLVLGACVYLVVDGIGITISEFREHSTTKNGKKNNDKHTKPRPGRENERKKVKSGWKKWG